MLEGKGFPALRFQVNKIHEIDERQSSPDAITPLAGYRVWAVGLGRLWSPQAPVATAWPVDRELTARCRHLEPRGPFDPRTIGRLHHSAPDPSCSCGIYAARDPWEIGAVDSRPPFRIVVGAVAGWGRVVICRRGWRAEHARIMSLFSYPWWDEQTTDVMTRTAENYGVPIVGWAEVSAASHGE